MTRLLLVAVGTLSLLAVLAAQAGAQPPLNPYTLPPAPPGMPSNTTLTVPTDYPKPTASKKKLRMPLDQLLSAPADLEARHASFLLQPSTGLIRLLPRDLYDGKIALSGGGSYYSFTQRSHDNRNDPDLNLTDGELRVAFAGADFGFLVKLGKSPLAEVTRDSAGVQPLADFVPPSLVAEARREQRRAREGLKLDKWIYRGALPAEVNRTYVLRSVKYGSSDSLVALRVVRKEPDGSLIILWRLLGQYPIPRLSRR